MENVDLEKSEEKKSEILPMHESVLDKEEESQDLSRIREESIERKWWQR